jgi:hypothetical protein
MFLTIFIFLTIIYLIVLCAQFAFYYFTDDGLAYNSFWEYAFVKKNELNGAFVIFTMCMMLLGIAVVLYKVYLVSLFLAEKLS